MVSSTGPSPPIEEQANRDVAVRRCRDPESAERILLEHYFQPPVCHFPRSLVRVLAGTWLTRSREIDFLTVDVAGSFAGFVFGHVLGRGIWHEFARSQLSRHALALAWVWVKLHWVLPARRAVARLGRTRLPARQPEDPMRGLRLPRIEREFRWHDPAPDIGQIELIVVVDRFRGRGIAQALLEALVAAMAGRGVTLVETQIRRGNYSSARAFQKAGFEVFETLCGSYYASLRVPEGGGAGHGTSNRKPV